MFELITSVCEFITACVLRVYSILDKIQYKVYCTHVVL
jgi:hypothetical protein